MIQYLILSLVIVLFIIATLEDIKKREVYDYINFFFTFAVLVIASLHSYISSSIEPLQYVGFGLLIGFALGSLLYFMGMWGGGDAKFLIGFSAATYYLLSFSTSSSQIGLYYDMIMQRFSELLFYIFDLSLIYILYLDIIFLVILGIHVIKEIRTTKRQHKKNVFNLLLILFFLYIGLALDVSKFFLFILGFISFALIFFSHDDIFSSIFFRIKKPISELTVGDRLDQDIKHKGKNLVLKKEARDGLNEHQVHMIKEKFHGNNLITLRKILPYAPLITLNFVIYLFKIISLDQINLEILSYQFKFLFYSFIAGGIIGIVVLLYYLLKNISALKGVYSKTEQVLYLSLLMITIVAFIVDIKIGILLLLLHLYFFLKAIKAIEKFIFVRKRSLDNIVLGDWIAQDILVDGKKVYSQKDFKVGIEEHQLEHLKELAKKHPSLKEVYVKDGIAFLPALLVGFVLILLL